MKDTGDHEVTLMMKHAPEWVRTTDQLSEVQHATYLWTAAPSFKATAKYGCKSSYD